MSRLFHIRMPTSFVVLFMCLCCPAQFLPAQDRPALRPSLVQDGPPGWLKDYRFKSETFTFVRLKYDQPVGRWATDYPDADINFSKRLGELTSLDVSPDGVVLETTDPHLREFPFAYLSANGNWELIEQQVTALREFLEGGGFLLIDDLWGQEEWENTVQQMKQVLPGRKPEEISLQHPIFHCVYDLQEKPQVCGIHYALQGRANGITWERPDAKQVGYYGITNDRGRMLVLICRNTDLADGWERVGDDEWYAREFSERRAFPLGINIVFHVLTAAK